MREHFQIVREAWETCGLLEVTGFLLGTEGARVMAIARCPFRDRAPMTAAPASDGVMEGVGRFTGIRPRQAKAVPF